MSDLLQENLMYLMHHKTSMFTQIQQYLESNLEKNCKLISGENGTINLSYTLSDDIKLLYAEDGSDVNKWINNHKYLQSGQYDVVMYGLGLTHHLAKMIDCNPSLNFYILEPEIDIFLESLKVIHLEQLLQHPQVKLLSLGYSDVELNVFHQLLNTYSMYEKVDVFIPYYIDINFDAVSAYYDANYTFREAKLLGRGYEKMFGTLPYRNSIRNIEKIYHSRSIKVLKNKFQGCTALIVGAGPSLELDIEHIKKNKDKLLIIAAGSSIQSLLHYGVEPHLAVSMDPGQDIGKAFNNSNTSNIPFVFVPQIYYEILNGDFHQLFYAFFNNDSVINFLFPDLDIDYRFRSTNSVTGTAIQIVKYLGAEKIIFAGQDMSFPGEQYYAQGAAHVSEERLKKRINTGALEVINVNGSMNRANISMISLRENIEKLIASIEGVEFINTSSLGAQIKGTEFVPFLQVINDMEVTYDFNEIKEVSGQDNSIDKYNIEDILKRLHDVTATCDELVEHGQQSLKLIRKIDELARRNPNQAMNALAKLENEFSKVTKSTMFNAIIPVWNRGLTQSYDQQVITIEAEPTIIGKSKLLNKIVVPYINEINISFNDIKTEIEDVTRKLTNGSTR